MFGGYLPVGDAQPKISSLKHFGNSVHKERKMRKLNKCIKRYRQIPYQNRDKGASTPSKHLAPCIREETKNVWNCWIYWK